MNMSKRIYWIIGASSGIGYALAQSLAKLGHTLIISARDENALIKLHAQLASTSQASHLIVPCDASDYDSLKSAKKIIYERLGYVDSVIFMSGQYHPMPTEALEIEYLKPIIETNLLGPMYLTEIILKDLLARAGSQIVFCASVAGFRGLPNAQPYGASKAGLINFVQSLHHEHGKHLDIKLINPGFVQTRLTDKNDFMMPFIITKEAAAEAIIKQLPRRHVFEIHFPKKFTYLLKLLNILPYCVYHRIMRR